ncbi:PucR family transcriptional regulator ligand-binding domain-containing protein [Glycomyces sp. L485]|uniref:PucR family transcriptional regulator n=1 Tax=Glycomyces sp. L485 TaxID=2909235 RepID=UPI001F4A3DA2|nr:PucR family transcriptional regulator [Glycomyces sp. L485]MCH7231965.1 PucR family transcriptional regulator ligand-binding domain-containing protein [Glycomyces sp. L485]
MRLRSLLQMPELGLTLLSGGHHLERRIRWVVPTDLHDPRRYLSGGELVLTGLMWRRAEYDSDAYVRNLIAAGVTALGAGDHPDFHTVPADLVAACEAHDLPLFAVDADVAFAEITERIVQRLSVGRSGDLASLLDRHRQLIAADGIGQILELLRVELGMECLVLSPTGRPIRGGLTLSEPDRAAVVSRAHAAGGLPQRVTLDRHRRYSVFGIGSTIQTGRFLVIDDDHTRWPPERRLVAEQLSALLMLELDDPAVRPTGHTELIAATREGAVDDGFLRRAGLPTGEHLAVIVAAGEPEELREVFIAETLAGPWAEDDPYAGPVAAWATHGSETVAVLAGDAAGPGERGRLLQWARRCADVLVGGGAGGSISVGLADPVRGAQSLRGALEQARHTAALAQPRPGGIDVAEPDHLVSHRMLLAAVPADVSRAFRTRVLDPLIEYDARHRSDLLPTLRRFLECDGSWRQCATTLHLHVNTVRYRMRRVEQLTGRDLRNPLDRMDLALAVSLE